MSSKLSSVLAAAMLALILGLASPANAATIVVGFGAVGGDSIDITTANNPLGYTLDGVTFRYDDFGSGIDQAWIVSFGVWGSPMGALVMDFDETVTQLSLDFGLYGLNEDVEDALFMILRHGQNDAGDLAFPTTSFSDGNALGSVAFTNPGFNNATLFFSAEAQSFTLSNMRYVTADTSAVPEPASTALLGSALIALGIWRRRCSR